MGSGGSSQELIADPSGGVEQIDSYQGEGIGAEIGAGVAGVVTGGVGAGAVTGAAAGSTRDSTAVSAPSQSWNTPGDWAASIGQGGGTEAAAAVGEGASQGSLVTQYASFMAAQGTPLSSDVVAALSGSNGINPKNGDPTYNNNGNLESLAPFINGYTSWMMGQRTAQQQFAAYQKAAYQQPGRDETILTGPQVSPMTALAQAGNPYGAPPARATAISAPKVGVVTR